MIKNNNYGRYKRIKVYDGKLVSRGNNLTKRDKNEIIKALNKISLKNCNHIKVGDVIRYLLLDKDMPVKGMLKSILRILRDSILSDLKFCKKGMPRTIMLFSNSYNKRYDLLGAFNKVCGIIDNYVKIYPEKYNTFCLNLKSIFLCIFWFRDIEPIIKDWKKSIYYVSFFHQYYCDYNTIVKYIKNEKLTIRSAVSLCDVMPADSFLIQKWNMEEIQTITLQHGSFNTGDNMYTGSISKYFLTHSIFSFNCAIQSGLDKSRVFIVGAPQNIGKINPLVSDDIKNVIGVILSGASMKKEDIDLLKMVRKYADRAGYKVYAKFHPATGPEKYNEDVSQYYDKAYTYNISIDDFGKLIDFSVDPGSTVFIEYTAWGKLAFTYKCDHNPYNKDDRIFLGFKNYQQMEELFSKFKTHKNELENLMHLNQQYLGTSEDPAILYRKFFEEYL